MAGELTPSGTEISFSIRLDATSKRRVIHLVPNGRTPDGVTDRLNFRDITPDNDGKCGHACAKDLDVCGNSGG